MKAVQGIYYICNEYGCGDMDLQDKGGVLIQRINISTKSRVEFQEITAKVQDAVVTSGIKSGVCYVFVLHTTAGITVNEHADPSVVEDIAVQLDTLIPQHNRYRHMEGNSPAHVKASLVGSSAVLMVEEGKLVLGTWQGVFFCEFDGPRNRNVSVKVIADKS